MGSLMFFAVSGFVLREYHLENFKAFGQGQTLPVRPITLIFGPNSSGKSFVGTNIARL